MKRRIFYVIYLDDTEIGAGLNWIRFLANPSARSMAHITVRGPYKRTIRVDTFNDALKDTSLLIHKVGQFSNSDKHVVFLECESPDLKPFWKKPDFKKSFAPHVTLYNGKSKTFANKLLKTISKCKIEFSLDSPKLAPLFSYNGQYAMVLKSELNMQFWTKCMGKEVKFEEIEHLEADERLALIDRICSFLSSKQKRDKNQVTEEDLVQVTYLSSPPPDCASYTKHLRYKSHSVSIVEWIPE